MSTNQILRAKPAPTPDGRVQVIDHEATKKHGRPYYKWIPKEEVQR